jgi:hypothetical protein
MSERKLVSIGHLDTSWTFNPYIGVLHGIQLNVDTTECEHWRLPRTNPFTVTTRYTGGRSKAFVRIGHLTFSFNVADHPGLREKLHEYWTDGKLRRSP